MKMARTGRTFPQTRSTAQIWTVVSLVEERIFCSVHPSEYHAYCEAVSRFESVELGARRRDSELKALLEVANSCGDYQAVRQYIADKSSQMRLLQLAEHLPSAMSAANFNVALVRPV